MSPRFIFVLLSVLSLSAQAAPAPIEPAAPNSPWYRIEVMLIAYEDADNIDHEHWPQELPAKVFDHAALDFSGQVNPDHNATPRLAAGFGIGKTPDTNLHKSLPADSLSLQEDADRINKQNNMKVIWHRAWIEPIQEQSKAILHPIDVHLLDRLNMHLSGRIQLYRSRYLHIDTDLVMQHSEVQPFLIEDSEALVDDQPETASNPNIRAGEIKLTRRMRSNELHYLDHPMLGVLVKVVPVENKAANAN